MLAEPGLPGPGADVPAPGPVAAPGLCRASGDVGTRAAGLEAAAGSVGWELPGAGTWFCGLVGDGVPPCANAAAAESPIAAATTVDLMAVVKRGILISLSDFGITG